MGLAWDEGRSGATWNLGRAFWLREQQTESLGGACLPGGPRLGAVCGEGQKGGWRGTWVLPSRRLARTSCSLVLVE